MELKTSCHLVSCKQCNEGIPPVLLVMGLSANPVYCRQVTVEQHSYIQCIKPDNKWLLLVCVFIILYFLPLF